jgi:hypothetical protein
MHFRETLSDCSAAGPSTIGSSATVSSASTHWLETTFVLVWLTYTIECLVDFEHNIVLFVNKIIAFFVVNK